MKPKASRDDADLFYINESSLATSDEDECLNLYELNMKPEAIADPVFRQKYLEFLERNKDTLDN